MPILNRHNSSSMGTTANSATAGSALYDRSNENHHHHPKSDSDYYYNEQEHPPQEVLCSSPSKQSQPQRLLNRNRSGIEQPQFHHLQQQEGSARRKGVKRHATSHSLLPLISISSGTNGGTNTNCINNPITGTGAVRISPVAQGGGTKTKVGRANSLSNGITATSGNLTTKLGLPNLLLHRNGNHESTSTNFRIPSSHTTSSSSSSHEKWRFINSFCCCWRDRNLAILIGMAVVIQAGFTIYINLRYVRGNGTSTHQSTLLYPSTTSSTEATKFSNLTSNNSLKFKQISNESNNNRLLNTSQVETMTKVKGSNEDNESELNFFEREIRQNETEENAQDDIKIGRNQNRNQDDDTIQQNDPNANNTNTTTTTDNTTIPIRVPKPLPPPSEQVLCMFRILGTCSNPSMEWLPYYGWFEDKELSSSYYVTSKEECYERKVYWNETCQPSKGLTQMFYSDTYYKLSIEQHRQQMIANMNSNKNNNNNNNDNNQQHQVTTNSTVTNVSSSLFVPPVPNCKFRISGDMNEKCEKQFASLMEFDGDDDSTVLNQTESSTTDGWFDDEMYGGPKPSTWWNCRLRRRHWIQYCSSNTAFASMIRNKNTANIKPNSAIVEMDYDGPGVPSNIKHDGSWEIIDIDGTIIHIIPTSVVDQNSDYQYRHPGGSTNNNNDKTQQKPRNSCYRMTRKPSFPYVPYVDFCYPTITIVGSSTNSISSRTLLQTLVDRHSSNTKKVVPIFPSNNYCRVLPHDSSSSTTNEFTLIPKSYYRYFQGFAQMTEASGVQKRNNNYNHYHYNTNNPPDTNNKNNEDESTTVLAYICDSPEQVMEYDVLLNGPHSLIIYVIQDIADQLYSIFLHHDSDDNRDNTPEQFHEKLIFSNYDNHNATPNTNTSDANQTKFDEKNSLSRERISNYYSQNIDAFESVTISQYVHTIAYEQLKSKYNTDVWWDHLSSVLQSRTGYTLQAFHSKLNLGVFNSNSYPEANSATTERILRSNDETKLYSEPITHVELYNKTRDLLGYWWDECYDLMNRTKWVVQHCHTSGYVKSTKFVKASKEAPTVPIQDLYLTIWSDQMDAWFQNTETDKTSRMNSYLNEAKAAGFRSILTELSWSQVIQGSSGNLLFNASSSFNLLSAACEKNFSIHLVVTAHEIPSWISKPQYWEDMLDESSCYSSHPSEKRIVSITNSKVWNYIQQYMEFTTKTVLGLYGKCIRTIIPALSKGSARDRFTITNSILGYRSSYSVTAFREWQVQKGFAINVTNANAVPPERTCEPICKPVTHNHATLWFGFQEEFASKKYIELCKIIHTTYNKISLKSGNKQAINCALRLGDGVFSTADMQTSNLLIKLAKSAFVDELIIVSNSLSPEDVPMSPSSIGIIVSAIQPYNKRVKFENTVNQITPCYMSPNGVDEMETDTYAIARIIFEARLQYALDAAAHGVGLSDACSPKAIAMILSSSKENRNEIGTDDTDSEVPTLAFHRKSQFRFSAVIFIPYRALYAWSSVIAGSTCGTTSSWCWHSRFDHYTNKLFPDRTRQPGTCPADTAQTGLIQVWDNLRTKHEHVAIIGDITMLTENLLNKADVVHIIEFPCVMSSDEWAFYEGEEIRQSFLEKASIYGFNVNIINMPNECLLEV